MISLTVTLLFYLVVISSVSLAEEIDEDIQIVSQSQKGSLRGRNNRLPTMKDLGSIAGTDKVLHHGYERFYPFFLERLRRKNIKMLEIGYLGGSSFKMWCEYFPRGQVFVMDKDGIHDDYPKRVKDAFFVGDQGNENDLAKMLSEKNIAGDLDFIIDDGSHHPEHQRVSLKYLFETALKPGGIYIIEDTEMNYWVKGDTYGKTTAFGKDHPNSLINELKQLADSVNREFLLDGRNNSRLGKYIDDWVSGIFFGHNCVVIVKMTTDEKTHYSRTYRHIDKITPN